MNSLLDHAACSRDLLSFSADGLEAQSQFCAWQEQVRVRIGLIEISRKSTGTFRARIETVSLGNLSLSFISGDAMTFERTDHHASLRDQDDFTIGFLLEGSAAVEQDGRRTNLSSGDLVLCDGRRPFRIHFDDPFRQIVFRCDRAQLEARLPDANRRTAQSIRGHAALCSTMVDYIAAMARQVASLRAIESIIGQYVFEILAFILKGASPRDAASRGFLARIYAYIEANLSDPTLSPAMIARQHRISRRHLYRLFSETGESVSEFIRKRRLVRCRNFLADNNHAKLGISEIAFACGFNDATTFGRAFRAKFGVTPRHYRRSLRNGFSDNARAQQG